MSPLNRRQFALAVAATPLAACQSQPEPTPIPSYTPPASEATWRSAPDAPYAVQEIYPALYRGGIWIAGGFSPQALGATERVIVYDIDAGVWRDGPPLPTPSHHVQLATLNDELWAIGGYIGGDTRMRWICTPRVLKLDGDRWVEAPALPKPVAEGMPLAHQGRIHLIGGRSPRGGANAEWNDQGDIDDHFVITPGAQAWTRAAPLPMARNSHAGAAWGDALHVISGRTVANGQTPAHHIYDINTDVWRNGPDFPEPRGGIAGAVWRGRVVACGGEIFEPGSVGDGLYAFDEANGWNRIETLPTARHGHGLVAAGDALYALGGAMRPSGNGTLASVDVLS